MIATTNGTLLDGRVRYAQPAHGFRSGIEPVLLAAAIPARAGERVLELGTGAGAALLCLATRVPSLSGTGIEIDPALAALAQLNAKANALQALAFLAADARALPLRRAVFDHAFANPPFHDPAAGPASPNADRARSMRASAGELGAWIAALATAIVPGGTVTLILPPAAVPEALIAFSTSGLGGLNLSPLWRRVGSPATRVLVRGHRDSRAPCTIDAGLVLHAASGRWTEAAIAILCGAGLTEQAERIEKQ